MDDIRVTPVLPTVTIKGRVFVVFFLSDVLLAIVDLAVTQVFSVYACAADTDKDGEILALARGT